MPDYGHAFEKAPPEDCPDPQKEKRSSWYRASYRDVGEEIGALVDVKNKAYGDSFHKAGEILAILYPQGAKPEQFKDLLTITRVVDKLFRIATDKDALGESPWRDIAGYAILSVGKNDQ